MYKPKPNKSDIHKLITANGKSVSYDWDPIHKYRITKLLHPEPGHPSYAVVIEKTRNNQERPVARQRKFFYSKNELEQSVMNIMKILTPKERFRSFREALVKEDRYYIKFRPDSNYSYKITEWKEPILKSPQKGGGLYGQRHIPGVITVERIHPTHSKKSSTKNWHVLQDGTLNHTIRNLIWINELTNAQRANAERANAQRAQPRANTGNTNAQRANTGNNAQRTNTNQPHATGNANTKPRANNANRK